jgi:adenine deaminase
MAVVHGTVATVSDPHEIGNVLGIEGVRYMIEDSKRTPFVFCFGAPSCVPATTFETAGAVIDPAAVRELLALDEVGYLAEVMNYPGVLAQDPDLMQKIAYAKASQKPVDGHAPGLRGEAAKAYTNEGISTDHECFTYEEAKEKIGYGMHILIREGSAARNFEALIPLLAEHPERIMFCSDDKHPDSLLEGHINQLVQRALAEGYDLFDVLYAACVNPVVHYSLPVGLLRVGDSADFIMVNNLHAFDVQQTYLRGQLVADSGRTLLPDLRGESHPNRFACEAIVPHQLRCALPEGATQVRVIEALEGQLITRGLWHPLPEGASTFEGDLGADILKLVVLNRYQTAAPAIAFIKNIGLKAGAIASTVAHDSHNIIALGCDDSHISEVINALIGTKGGVAAVGNGQLHVLPLPIAGLMTDQNGYEVAERYTTLDQFVKEQLGASIQSPFMVLSFMALLVIPSLKLSDKGLFDGDTFQFTPLCK